jgi:cell division transport system permease protein
MLLNKQIRALSVASKKIIRHPFEHLMNMTILSLLIGVIVFVLIINNTNLKWQNNDVNYPQIMVSLADNVSNKDVSRVQVAVSGFSPKAIKGFQYISKEDALKELQADSQLKDISSEINLESNNTLPNILIINTNTTNTKILEQLKNKISGFDFVKAIELDETYSNKLASLLSFINDATYYLLIFFSICLILVLYTFIRLQMFQNKEEISVSRLIGASDLFIMRPLVYYTIIQVIISGLIGYLGVSWLIASINGLSFGINLGSNFHFIMLNKIQIIQLILTLIVFSIFAVFFAVMAVLRRYHPR